MLLHQRANHEDQKFKRHRKSISVSWPLSVKQAIKSHLLSQNIEPFKYQAGVFFSPLPLPPFLLLPLYLLWGLIFLLSPIFHCHKIKDGNYSNITNTNKVSPTQNTPALQAAWEINRVSKSVQVVNIKNACFLKLKTQCLRFKTQFVVVNKNRFRYTGCRGLFLKYNKANNISSTEKKEIGPWMLVDPLLLYATIYAHEFDK